MRFVEIIQSLARLRLPRITTLSRSENLVPVVTWNSDNR